MNSPFSKGTLYLKRRNQDLLAQLESNSAILQDRLEKLCKAPWPSTAQSPEQLQCTPLRSPLKRKHGYESWLLRNNSGQVSAALNPNVFWNSTPSPILNRNNVPLTPQYVDEAITMSPAKRPKRYGDNCQERQGNTSTATPLVSLRSTKSRRKCPECYCQASKQQPAPRKHGRKCAARVCIACSEMPHNSLANIDNSPSNLDSQRKTLEEARSVINYSPESVFLKGLKKRSKVNLDEPETSESPEMGREHSGQSAKAHKSKRSKPVAKASANEQPEHARPIVKSPSFGVSNVSGKSGYSRRRGISESSKSGRRQDESSKESSHPIANSSSACRSTSSSTRKFTTKVSSGNISTLVSRIPETTCDEPRSSKEFNRPTTSNAVPSTSTAAKYGHSPTKNTCKPALARLIPTKNYKTAMSPPLTNNRQPATRSTRHAPSPPANESTKQGFKSSKHGVISPAKDHLQSATSNGKSKTTRAKSRAASSRATCSTKRDSRVSPIVSSVSSPSSSPARGDLETHPDSSESTCPIQTRENCRPVIKQQIKKSKKTKCKLHPREGVHKSDVSARRVPHCCYTGTNLKAPPVASSPCKKYTNIYKPYCKKYCRKEKCEAPFDTIENKFVNECYHNIVPPTVIHCKPYKQSHRKSTRVNRSCGNSCCNNCCCGCLQPFGYDACPRIVDGEPAMRKSHSCECGHGDPTQNEWVDEMSRYRQSHWFDCHAYPTNRERPACWRVNSESLHTNHDSAHRYILNDRLFPTPLPCTSHCVQCQQPADTEIRPRQQRFPREITLNTARNHGEVKVVLPQAPISKHRADEPKAGPFKIYHDLEKKAKASRKSTGCMLTHPIHSKPLLPKFPVPANSLALRYQRGIV